jgi:hypothetical protein
MLITEILHWNSETTDVNRSDPQFDLPSTPFDDSLPNLANAFTKDGRVKHLWNLGRSESQPSGPAPPNYEQELVSSGTVQPTTASWEAEPVEEEPPVGQYRRVPVRRYRDPSAY